MDAENPCEQMANFLSVVGRTGDILLVVDFEVYESSQPTASQAAAAVMMVKSVTGRLPVLYTGRYVLSSANSMLSQCPLWLANTVRAPFVRRAGRNGSCGSIPTGGSAADP